MSYNTDLRIPTIQAIPSVTSPLHTTLKSLLHPHQGTRQLLLGLLAKALYRKWRRGDPKVLLLTGAATEITEMPCLERAFDNGYDYDGQGEDR